MGYRRSNRGSNRGSNQGRKGYKPDPNYYPWTPPSRLDKPKPLSQSNYDQRLAGLTHTFGFPPTNEQVDIFDWLNNGEGHGVIEAVAGSGKSTSLFQAAHMVDSATSILYIVFGKANAKEAYNSPNRPTNLNPVHFHKIGYHVCKQHLNRLNMKADKTGLILMNMIYGGQDSPKLEGEDKKAADKRMASLASTIKRVVSLAKSYGYGTDTYEGLRGTLTLEAVHDIMEFHNIEEVSANYIADFNAMILDIYEKSVEDMSMLDFDDMLLFPIIYGWEPPAYMLCLVDEAQDLNDVRRWWVHRITRHEGARALFVGDTNQAILGFTGARCDSLQLIIDDFDAHTMPLYQCWRCPVNVINEALPYMPNLKPAPNADAGEVHHIDNAAFRDIITDGDLVLCRTIAPMVSEAMKAIKVGKKAIVLGRTIADGLIRFIDDAIKHYPNEAIIDAFTHFYQASRDKLAPTPIAQFKNKDRIEALDDRYDCLLVFTEQHDNIADIKSEIDRIFSDQHSGIVFSTVHKAKGLENDRVFILGRNELMPSPRAEQPWEIQQEENLIGIAITRAKQALYYVALPADEKSKAKTPQS